MRGKGCCEGGGGGTFSGQSAVGSAGRPACRGEKREEEGVMRDRWN